VAALSVQLVVTVHEAIAEISLAYLYLAATNSLFIDVCDQTPVRLPNMHDKQLLMLR
jgi:hypothetical protein